MKRALGLVLFLNSALATQAFAAGFGLKETSAAAMGSAYAGAAADDSDPGHLSYNPALLLGVEDTDASLSVVEIVPHSSANYTVATTAAGTPASGTHTPSGYIADSPIPSIAIRHRMGDKWAVGLTVDTPFGLKTNYPQGWAGRYYALESEAITVDITPTIAYQLTPELSLGAGLNVEYVRGVLTSAIDIGSIGLANHIPGAAPGAFDGMARLSGFDWNEGFVVGALYKPMSDMSVGLSYRSSVHHTLEGPLTFTLDSAGLGAAIRGATGLFTNSRASAGLSTPDELMFGVRKDVSDRFTALVEVDWTNWTTFKTLTVTSQNPAQPPDVTVGNWHDTVFASVGGEYRLDDALKLRGGVAYDQTPVPDATLSPRIPDTSRVWLAAGVEYRFTPGTALNLSYGHLFNDDAPVALSNTQPGNALRGNLAGSTRSSVDTIGVQISSAF